ncbi:MAG: D-alanyl-D-alanine carboxypeptidase [Lachnospiraceae bacterium]|nr:D-alanyl-D-alanine carboxypeptidase [Lachnospiraceae bacterium]
MFRAALLLILCIYTTHPIYAQATQQDFLDAAEERKDDPVESNDREKWPDGPAIGAKAAALMDVSTGAMLYAKDAEERLYPASITKLMTCLVAIENCPLDELITVNQSAINANASDGSNMGLTAGEQLTLEEMLYGILINSANEACNAVGEHIGGSMDGYVDMMNAKAAELGCTNTHFVTTNGLHDEDHYTCARDMALIARAFYSYDYLCTIASTPSHHISETELHGEHYLHSKNRLYAGGEYEYEKLVGSKTGFTSHSRQTLVSCAKEGETKLVCVILMEESPYQFTDTVELFEYGFNNFVRINPAASEERFRVSNSDFFESEGDLFGSTSPLLYIEKDASVLVPEGFTISDLDADITYDSLKSGVAGHIEYSYLGIPLGGADILVNTAAAPSISFTDGEPQKSTGTQSSVEAQNAAGSANAAAAGTTEEPRIYINVITVLKYVVISALGVALLYILIKLLIVLHKRNKRRRQIRRRSSEVLKSRGDLRRSYSRHAPLQTGKRSPSRYILNNNSRSERGSGRNSQGSSQRRRRPPRP